MIDSPWLNIPKPSEEEKLRMLAVKELPDMKWVKDSEGRCGLGLELSPETKVSLSASFEHLTFDVIPLTADLKVRVFSVFCQSSQFQELFKSLCIDLLADLSHIPTESARAKAILSRAKAWASFFKSGGRRLSLEKQLGLISELKFLREYWLETGQPLEGWVGPLGAAQDFQNDALPLAIELKSIDQEFRVKITSIYQLEAAVPLYLCGYRLVSSDEGASLDDEVETLRESLSDAERLVFNQRLLQAGYSSNEGYQDKYKSAEFIAWHVTEEFPKITALTNPAVQSCRYQLSLKPYAKDFLIEQSFLEKTLGTQ